MFRFCLQHHPPLELLLPQEPRSTQEHLRKTQSLLGPRVKFSTHVSRSRLVPKCPKCDRPCDLFQHKTNMQTHTKHKLPLLREKSWGEGQLKGWVILRAEAVFSMFLLHTLAAAPRAEKSTTDPKYFSRCQNTKDYHQNQCTTKDFWYFRNLPRKMLFRKTSFFLWRFAKYHKSFIVH